MGSLSTQESIVSCLIEIETKCFPVILKSAGDLNDPKLQNLKIPFTNPQTTNGDDWSVPDLVELNGRQMVLMPPFNLTSLSDLAL